MKNVTLIVLLSTVFFISSNFIVSDNFINDSYNVKLEWVPPVCENINGYKIYIGTNNGIYYITNTIFTLPIIITNNIISNITPKQVYYISMSSFNDNEESILSEEIQFSLLDKIPQSVLNVNIIPQ